MLRKPLSIVFFFSSNKVPEITDGYISAKDSEKNNVS